MDLLSLTIVGAIASVITQFIKKKFPDGLARSFLAIIVSLVVGAIAYVLNYLPALKEALLGTVIIANVVYNALIKYLFPEEGK
jgi:uncharacterized membrane protein YeaQ/YmgE (transglycosylase-associated protein family)